MTRRMGQRLDNGVDRDGFTVGINLAWSHVFFGIIGILFLVLAFFVGLVIGLGGI